MKLYVYVVDYFKAHPVASGFLGSGTTLAAVNWERLTEVQERMRAVFSTASLACTLLILSPQVFDAGVKWMRRLRKWWSKAPKKRSRCSTRPTRALKRKPTRARR